MRVAHVLRKYDPDEWGGVETAVLQLLKGLRSEGVEGVVFAPRLKHPPASNDPFASAGFSVRRYRAVLPVLGISVEERKRRLAVGGNIMSLELLKQLLDAPNDLIHTHTLNRIGGTVRVASRLRAKPYVASIHGGYLDIPPQVASDLRARGAKGIDLGKPFGMLVGSRHVVDDAAAVFTVNPRETELLRQKNPSLHVETMPQPVDAEAFAEPCEREACERFEIREDAKVILCVGRIHSVKNQVFLVEALQALQKKIPNALLVIVGGVTDEDYAAKLRQKVRELGLGQAVKLLDPLSPGDKALAGLYQRADLFSLASTAEPLGLVFVEAVMAGTPFLGSDTAGAKHVAKVTGGGEVFALGDRDAFLDAAERMLRQPRTAAEREQARQNAMAEFSARAVARRHLEGYERACADFRLRV